MASKHTFGRISDAQVLALMDVLLATFTTGSASVSIGDAEVITIEKSTEGHLEIEGRDEYEKILRQDTYLITSMVWKSSVRGQVVRHFRGRSIAINPQNNGEHWVPAPNPYIDGLDHSGPEENAEFVLKIISDQIAMAPPIAAGPEADPAIGQSAAILNRVYAN